MIFMMAWRNVWRHKARSLVIMLSIALGLFAGMAVLALYEGMMKSRVRTVIDEETGHIQIHAPAFTEEQEPKYYLGDEENLQRLIASLPEVLQINRRILVNGMLSTPTGTAGVQVLGIDTATEYSFSSLRKKIKEGTGFRSDKKNQAVVGWKLARKMKLQQGSKLVLMFNDTANNLVSAAFRVAAIYQSANAPLDERLVYVQRHELGELIGLPGQIHEIGLKLRDDNTVDPVAAQLRKSLPHLKVDTWKDLSPETELMVRTVDTYSYVIMIIIMIALAFGILNTMLMAIMERTREIGMIAALGTSRSRIFSLVLLETVFLTLAGTPIGLLSGIGISSYYHKHGLDLSGMGEDMMRNYGFSTLIYPEFPAAKLLPVMAIVIITAMLSSLLPALKAIRMKPIEALRK